MQKSFTVEMFRDMLDKYFPVLYYGLDKNIERGIIYLCNETDFNPEFIIVHPDDFEEVKTKITARRLVHLRDEPKDKVLARLQRTILTKYGSSPFDLPGS